MRRLFGLILALGLLVPACASVPAAQAPAPTPVPPPMANKLIVYGDTTLFTSDQKNPEVCAVKSRYKPGESVGFRMTAIDPMTGKPVEDAELTVKLANGVTVPMRYRGTGDKPHPGMWTGKWTIPADAKTGVVKYTVEAKDKSGRTGTFQPFDVEPSLLTIVQ